MLRFQHASRPSSCMRLAHGVPGAFPNIISSLRSGRHSVYDPAQIGVNMPQGMRPHALGRHVAARMVYRISKKKKKKNIAEF
eukprot:4595721-Prymnesium_polylepis.1